MLLLPGFHPRVMRRKPRSVQQKYAEKMTLLKQKSFKQIGELFEDFIPRTLLFTGMSRYSRFLSLVNILLFQARNSKVLFVC